MPIYEYRCESCKRISTFLLLRSTEEIVPYCKACGSEEVKRQVSRVAILKGEEKMTESLLDPSKLSDLDENDPASVERVMRRMGRELGDELGEDFQESMEEALSGEAAPLEESL